MYKGEGFSHFDRAIVTVLSTIISRQLLPGHEKTTNASDLYELFGEDFFALRIACGFPISKVFEALTKVGDLEDSGKGYALTSKGMAHLSSLLMEASGDAVLVQNARIIVLRTAARACGLPVPSLR